MNLVEAMATLNTVFLVPLQEARTALAAVQAQEALAQKLHVAPRMQNRLSAVCGGVDALIADVQSAIQTLNALRQEPVPEPAP